MPTNSPFNRKTCAVVTFLSTATELTEDEVVTVRHMHRYLGRYDLFAIGPKSGTLEVPGLETVRVADKYFGSARKHTAFLFGTRMYDMFREYDYLLLHHLDAIVFSDQLLDWCNRGYDYVAAPWWAPLEDRFYIGCGGFSLRRVEALRDLYDSKAPWVDPEQWWEGFSQDKTTFQRLLHSPKRYLKRLNMFNNIRRDLDDNIAVGEGLEDVFIIRNWPQYAPTFRIAPLEEALRFGYSEPPETCAEAAGGLLPFGCHPWYKYKYFWEGHILYTDDTRVAQDSGDGSHLLNWPPKGAATPEGQ